MPTSAVSSRSARFGAAALATLLCLLAGCSPVAQPNSPSVDNLNALIQQAIHNYWMPDAGSDDLARADVERLDPVPGRRTSSILVECRGVSGARTIEASVGGLRFDPLRIQPRTDGSEPFALCRARMSTPDIAVYLYGEDQLRYLHRYFVKRLRWCLALAGYAVGQAPELATFIAEFPDVAWTPYRDVDVRRDSVQLRQVEARCPPRPPALDW